MTFQTPYKCCLVARNSDYQITSYMKRPEEPGPRNCETAIKNLAPAHCVERTKIHKLPCMWVLLHPDAYKVSETLISGLLETGHLTWPICKKMYCFLTCRTSVTCPKTGLTQVGIKSRLLIVNFLSSVLKAIETAGLKYPRSSEQYTELLDKELKTSRFKAATKVVV